MDGFEVLTMAKAAEVGDIFVTATGDKGVIRQEHMETIQHASAELIGRLFEAEEDRRTAAFADLANRFLATARSTAARSARTHMPRPGSRRARSPEPPKMTMVQGPATRSARALTVMPGAPSRSRSRTRRAA